MEKQNLRIYGNGVRSGTSPSKIHQITQTSNSPFKENGDQSPNLFRLSDFAPSGSRLKLREDLKTAIFLLENLGFFNKLGENDGHTMSGDRVLGDGYRLSEYDFGFSKGKLNSILAQTREILKLKQVTVRVLAQLIGKLTAAIPAVQLAPLHYRHLQMASAIALMKNQITKI